MNKVTKQEFDNFILSYDGELTKGVSAVCEPPVVHYFDEMKGVQPEDVVAQICLDWLGPNGDVNQDGKYYEYSIRGDF